jgi:hypothetical protein
VNRRAHQRRADDLLARQRALELGGLEAVEARPEPDRQGRRPLRLEPGDAFDGPRDR